ncbi:MAG: transporter [Alphaproteobacteria bacterium]
MGSGLRLACLGLVAAVVAGGAARGALATPGADPERRLHDEVMLLREEQQATGRGTHPEYLPPAALSSGWFPPVLRTASQVVPTDATARTSPRSAAREAREEGLLPPGRMVFEPSVEYVRSDVSRADMVGFTVLPGDVVGAGAIAEARREAVLASAGARLGLTDRLEVETRVPYVYRHDTLTSRPSGGEGGAAEATTSTTATGRGIGDVEVSGRYRINDGRNGHPLVIGSLRVKSPTGRDPFAVSHEPVTRVETDLPTGTGFWALQPSLTVVLPGDPVTIHAGLGYTWNVARDIGGGRGHIDPGDVVGMTLGVTVSAGEDVSFSLGYDHGVVFASTRDGRTLSGSSRLSIGTLTLGGSYRLTERTSVTVSLGIGLSRDAPNLRILVKVPLALNVW